MLTEKKLRAFIKRRNKSSFPSNLQFQIDANASGFSVSDLGEVQMFTIDGFKGYQWKPAVTKISNHLNQGEHQMRLIEFGRLLYLSGDEDEDTQRMFELMNTACFE